MALYDDHGIPCNEIRKLPLSPKQGSNILVSYKGYLKEITFRKERNKSLGHTEQFKIPLWQDLEVYDKK